MNNNAARRSPLRHPTTGPAAALLTLLVTALLPGCQQRHVRVEADDPELAAWVELVMPTRIEVLEWTRPVSLAGDGNADALEVILAAYDALDDETKAVGKFHFELRTRRIQDRIGTRVAFWPVEVDTADAVQMYRDNRSDFYHFPLALEESPLPPGRYVLTVKLHLPTDTRLVDEYEFDYEGGTAPPPSTF